MSSNPRRSVDRLGGFTLIEILVVIAIIGILMSLTASYIGPARERARSMQCQENLRQIAIATINYESSKGHLPAYCQSFGEFVGGVDPSDPGSFGGSVPRHLKVGGWQVALLARLDHLPHYEHWTLDRYPILSDGSGDRESTLEGYSLVAASNLSIYICPSATGGVATRGMNHYVANNGMHADVFPFVYTRPGSGPTTVSWLRSMSNANGALNNQYAGINSAAPTTLVAIGRKASRDHFTDGLGNTLLFTENNQAQPWYLTRLTGNSAHLTTLATIGGKTAGVYPPESRYMQGVVWNFEDNSGFAGAAPVDDLHRINGGDVLNDLMDATNFSDLARPSSLHPGGVNAVMADGSVRVIGEQIDYRLYQALMTPRGRSSDVPANEFVPTEAF